MTAIRPIALHEPCIVSAANSSKERVGARWAFRFRKNWNGCAKGRRHRSTDMNATHSGTSPLDEGYTFYLLALDGTIATLKKTHADDAFELTVEMRDRQARRKLPAEVASNPRSAEFARALREVKAELLRRRRSRSRAS